MAQRGKIGFLIPILIFATVLTFSSSLQADTIHFEDGRTIEGTIISETGDSIVIKTKYGTQTIDRLDVIKIERGLTEKQEYEKRLDELNAGDADGHYELGKWCMENGMEEEAEGLFEKAIEINPDHEETRKVLGYQKHEGEWLTEEEVMESRGLRKWQGQWIPEEDYNRLLKEKVQREKEREAREAAAMAEEVRKATEAAAKEYEGVPWSEAHKKETDHFKITCNSTVEIMERYAKLMEWLYAKYSKVFAAFQHENRKCNIYIHRSHQEFMQMRRKPAGVGGFYMPGRYQLVAFHGSFGATSDTTTVLAHEGTHLFQDLIGMFGRPVRSPIWLIEGLAVLMEAADINWKNGKITIDGVSRDRLVQLQAELSGKRGKEMPLTDVMNTPQRGFSGRHYGYAGMFTYWMLQGSRNKKLALLYNDYVKIATGPKGGGSGGRKIESGDFQNLLDKHMRCSMDEINEAWKKWVLKQKPDRLVYKRGNKYTCKKLGFSVERPSSKWRGETEDVLPGEMVVFNNRKLDARISVRASGNFMNYTLESLVTAIKKSLDQSTSKGSLTDYKFVSEKFDQVNGHKVYDYSIIARSPKSSITTDLMKRRTVYFVLPDNLYIIGLMAPPDKYDECLVDFMSVIEGFEIDL